MIRNLTVNEQKLYELRMNSAARKSITDIMIGAASRAWASPAYPEEGKPLSHISAGIKNTFNGITVLTCGFIGTITEGLENNKRRKQIAKASGYAEEKIAMDINEFINHSSDLRNAEDKEQVGKINCYGDSIRYSAQTAKEGYTDIETIFGDAHFEALDEVSCISNLKNVLGSVYFSRCHDLTGLNLEVVGGDFHGEKLTSASGLENLRFVGGRIYYQDNEYSLSSFKRDVLGIKVKELK